MSMQADLHQAIISALVGDALLTDLLGRQDAIHDVVPARRQFPFVTLAEINENAWSTDESAGRDALVTIRVWSRAPNRAQLYELSDRITALMTNLAISAGATRVTLVTPVSSAYERDVGSRCFRATLRFRCLVEPANN